MKIPVCLKSISVVSSLEFGTTLQLDFPHKARGQLQRENDMKFLELMKQNSQGKPADQGGMYAMLQEYMVENETLRYRVLTIILDEHSCCEAVVNRNTSLVPRRTENSGLQQSHDQMKRDQQVLARENERLLRKLDQMERCAEQ